MAFGSSMKDKAALAVVGMVVMYAVAGFMWFTSVTDKASSWNRSRRKYSEAVKTYRNERALIQRRSYWNEEYDSERSKMPMFPEGESVDTHWVRRMVALANENHISISSRQGGKEIEVGDVYEMPIEVKGWEASLDSLVKFMFALEHTDEAMFDIKSIDMRPSPHKGYLKGQFTLNCAYMRGDVEEESEDEEESEEGEETSKDETSSEKEVEKEDRQ